MERCILLIDSSAGERALLAALLVRHGFRALEAGDGSEALMLAAVQAPDAIVLELGAGSAGVPLQLRSSRSTARIPLICLSIDPGEGLAAGCSIALSKPCAPEHLLAAIAAAIGE
jgi:DNA-binding response OmpR family regulator